METGGGTWKINLFPHLNYEIGGKTGHLYLGNKIENRGEWSDFVRMFGL